MLHFVTLISMCLLYIIQGVIQDPVIDFAFILITILAFLQAFSNLDKRNKVFTGTLFLTGILVHFLYGGHGLDLVNGITQNLPLLSVVLLAPLISIPLKGEGIINSFIHKINKYKHNHDEQKTFLSISSFMLMLGPILNMGAIRIINNFVENMKINKKLLSNSYYGGFTPAIMWSPFFASVGIVLSITEISYLTYLPIGIIFAGIQFIIAVIILSPRKNVPKEAFRLMNVRHEIREYVSFILIILFLMGLLITLEYITQLPILLLVSINCIILPLLWTVIRKRVDWMKVQIKKFKNQMITTTNFEVSLFLSAGIFGTALMHTPISKLLKKILIWSAEGSVTFVFLFVLIFITILAFLGVHQIISIPIILPILLNPELDLTVLTVSFMCIFSWMFSSSISPLNALNIIISNCVGVNGIKSAIYWNGHFFFILFLIANLYIIVLNQF